VCSSDIDESLYHDFNVSVECLTCSQCDCLDVAVPNSPNSFLYLVWVTAYSALETICKGCKMSEPIRYESAERVRDFYREQGKATEQQRIIHLLLALKVGRRCAATNKLVAVTTNMEEVVYLTGFEQA
jgi:hypothetical protein